MSFGHLLRSIGRSLRVIGYFLWFSLKLVIKRPQTPPERARWLHDFAATTLRGMGFSLSVEGEFPVRGGVVISNHVGYLDIVVFAAIRACSFVSKAEIANWPVLGWMTTMAGTVYVQRGRGGSAVRARAGLQTATDAGVPVVFFPEGTTSNGEQLLMFHSGLLAQALALRIPVTAAYLYYTIGDNNDPGFSVADDVSYWGDEVTLVPHLFRLLGLRGLHAHVRFAPASIGFSSHDPSRKLAAIEARAAVMKLMPEAKQSC